MSPDVGDDDWVPLDDPLARIPQLVERCRMWQKGSGVARWGVVADALEAVQQRIAALTAELAIQHRHVNELIAANNEKAQQIESLEEDGGQIHESRMHLIRARKQAEQRAERAETAARLHAERVKNWKRDCEKADEEVARLQVALGAVVQRVREYQLADRWADGLTHVGRIAHGALAPDPARPATEPDDG